MNIEDFNFQTIQNKEFKRNWKKQNFKEKFKLD